MELNLVKRNCLSSEGDDRESREEAGMIRRKEGERKMDIPSGRRGPKAQATSRVRDIGAELGSVRHLYTAIASDWASEVGGGNSPTVAAEFLVTVFLMFQAFPWSYVTLTILGFTVGETEAAVM
jgi:hypothetical protein